MRLNLEAITERCQRNGLSQADISDKLSVSRECISKWLNHESFPRPRHLLALGRLLSLKHSELVIDDAPKAVVAFRHHSGHCHLLTDEKTACQIGKMLEQMVPFVTQRTPEQPLRLKEPQCSVSYVEEICQVVRRRYDLHEDLPIPLSSLVRQAFQLDAVLVPALWGRETDSDNGLSIYLPDSRLTWIILNLDVRVCDFRYWLAHELAHAYAIEGVVDAETFAELFAQHLLFPDCQAEKLYSELKEKSSADDWYALIQRYACRLEISARMVQKALQDWTQRNHLPNRLADDVTLATAKGFDDASKSLFQVLFGTSAGKITFADYSRKTADFLGDTFWKTLKKTRQAGKLSPGCIQQILKTSFIDAKEIWAGLGAV